MESILHGLEKIHGDIVVDLGIAAYKNGELAPEGDAAVHGGAFDNAGFLRRRIAFQLDESVVRRIEAAETLCVETLEQAIASDDVSSDIKMHVFGAVSLLKKRHRHIDALRALAAKAAQRCNS